MSSSKNDQALNDPNPDLGRVRAEIDKLDQTILKAIEDRAALAAQVSQAKSGRHTFRPGREADLIRNLVQHANLPSKLIEQIWRNIIAHNLTSQAGLKIALQDDRATMAAATFRFGTNYETIVSASADDVITAVASGQADLGILADWQADQSWLDVLHHHRQAGAGVYISAYTHMLADHGLQQSVVLSSILPDPSSNDTTLVMIENQLSEIQGHHPEQPGILGIIQNCDIS